MHVKNTSSAACKIFLYVDTLQRFKKYIHQTKANVKIENIAIEGRECCTIFQHQEYELSK